MSTVPIICVESVEKTSELLQELFDWKSEHGGSHFDDLVDDKHRSVLWLHDFDSDHHSRFDGVGSKPLGVGFSVYVLVKDIEKTYERAKVLEQEIIEELHMNENAKFREFTLKIREGYQFTACEKSEWLKI